jgi:pimeloyl-ACP methyl ester carboxylesterase
VPSEHQDVWRVDLHAVARLKADEQHIHKLKYYRWEKNRWAAADAETFFQTHKSEIPLIFFAPGYTSTTQQTTQVGLGLVRNFDPDKPCRIVFWDWFADRGIGNIRRDIRSKLPIVNNTADYLALLLQKLQPQSKVCLFGFSFGSRIACNAAEALRKSGRCPEGLRLHLVLSGAATDRNWFAKGQQHCQIPEIVEKILITYSPDDWVLRFYPWIYDFQQRQTALGLEGLPMRSIAPEFRDRFENFNVNRYIGGEHQTLFHVRSPVFQSRIGTYFFFE